MAISYNKKYNPFTGKLQFVRDSTSVDSLTFKAGVATVAALPSSGNTKNDARIVNDTHNLYVWSGTAWVDQGDIIDMDWSAITGKPTSSVSDIDDAVTKKHAQNTDTKLDEGGANEKLASDLVISQADGDWKKVLSIQYNPVTEKINFIYETD